MRVIAVGNGLHITVSLLMCVVRFVSSVAIRDHCHCCVVFESNSTIDIFRSIHFAMKVHIGLTKSKKMFNFNDNSVARGVAAPCIATRCVDAVC